MVFIGTSGILGRFVPVPAPVAIWWRALIALGLLVAFCRYKGLSFRTKNRRQTGLILLSGLLMAGHWVLYFYALKLGSVAIGMLSIFTYPAMTTLLEPLLLKSPFHTRHLLLAALVILGIYFLAPNFSLADGKTVGLVCGLCSAFVYSLRNILMKTQVDSLNGSVIMCYQVAVTLIVVAPALWLFPGLPPASAWPYLLGLGLLTTTIGHTLLLACFRYFSVSTVSLLSCVQPIYGILLGVIFFREIPDWYAVLGGALILSAVAIEAASTLRRSASVT